MMLHQSEPIAKRTSKVTALVMHSALTLFCLASAAVSSAQTTANPSVVSFPAVQVGVTSAPVPVTFSNQSGAPIAINSIATSAPFAVSGTNCPLSPSTLGSGFSCTVSVTFTPAEGGFASGSLTIGDSASNSPSTVALQGNGTGGATSVSPAQVNFGPVLVNQSSTATAVTFTNNQSSAITLGKLQTSGDFALTGVTTCGSSLGPSASCRIYMTFTPTAGGVRQGVLSIPDSVDAVPVSVGLRGIGLAPVTVSPASFNFGKVVDNQTSAFKAFTLANNQGSPLTINSVTGFASGFALDAADTTCAVTGGTLPANSTCVLAVTFTPSATGSASATLSISASPSTGPVSIPLLGYGIPPISISKPSLSFGNVVLNTTSAIQTTTLTNNQPVSAAISSISVPPGTMFALDPSTTCANPGTLGAGASCIVAVTFTPTSSGQQTSTLTIAFGGGLGSQPVALGGFGINPVTLTPAHLNFGQAILNTSSTAQVLTLTNSLSSPLTISSVIPGGPFALASGSGNPTTCPTSGGSLAAGTSCLIGVVFQPTVTGPSSGQITVVDSSTNSPQFSTISGYSVPATSLSPAVINFGYVVENTASAVRTFNLINHQTVVLHIASISTSAPYAIDQAATTCGATLAAGATCAIAATFTPTALGTAPVGAITITHDAVTSPQSVPLYGVGITPVTVIPLSPGFGSVVVGQPATANFRLTNNQSTALTISSIGGFTGSYSLNTANTTCPISPLTLAGGASCIVAVSLNATGVGSQPGSVTITDSASNSPQVLPLSAYAVQPVLLSPSGLWFGSQFLGATSAPSIVTVTNNQNVPLTIASASIAGAAPGDFSVASSCPSPVPAASSCTLSVTFSPSATGRRNAVLNLNDNALGSPQSMNLGGAGNAPLLVSPTSITGFGAAVGSTSSYATVTLKNNTSNPITITAFQFSGDFQQTSTSCGPTASAPPPYTLAAGASCNVTTSFAPTVGGLRDGQLLVYDSAATSPQVVNLSGTGTHPLTFNAGILGFGAQTIGTVSAPFTVKLTNHEVQSETFTLSPSANFTATSTCGNGVIAAQSTCLVSVVFAPSASAPQGTITGTLTVANSAPNGSPLNLPLFGSAISTNPAPAISVISPSAGAAGTLVPVVITGNGWTHFSSSSVITFVDTNSRSIPSGIVIVPGSQVAVSPNQIDATLQLTGTGVTYGARDLYVKTPLAAGGTETAHLLSAFIIADPSNAHSIVSVAPAFGAQGQTLNVSLSATGTSFVQGTTYANFGDGITVNSLTITDGTDATANITISNTTPVGYRTITMVTGGEFATSVPGPSGNPIFQVGPNSATLLSISPNSEPQGFAGQVTLTASGTHFLQNATQVSISGGVVVGDVQVTSDTTATAQVAVPSGAAIGVDDVTVSTGGEIATLPGSFTVTGATPGLISVAPNSAAQGQSASVVITGNAYTAFNACPGGVLLADFTGEISTGAIAVNSANQVTVPITVSPNANVGAITARLTCGGAGNATIFPFTFSVTASGASIVSVTPGSVPQGGQLTLAVVGSNTSWVQGTTVAAFFPQGVPVPSFPVVTIDSPTTATLNISVPVSTPPGTYPFYMATGGQVVTASVTVYAQTPTLTMSPANGAVPTNSTPNSFSVSFTGQFTHFSGTAAPVTLPVIAGQGVTLSNFTVTSPVSATATLTIAPGAATGNRLVTFTTGGEIVTTYFNVTSTPVGISLIDPSHAPQNSTLSVSIVGLNTHFQSGVTQVLFGPQITVNTVTVIDATHLSVSIATSYTVGATSTPTPPGYQNVYVNTGAEQVIGGFSVDSPATPTLVSVTPNSGAQGSTESVTITGSLTNWVQGQTQAILGAGVTVSNLNITSPTTATATIAISPTAPIGGNSVIMITGSEIVSGTGFSVTPSAAYVASVEPSFICSTTGTIGDLNCTTGNPPTGVPQIAQLQTATLNITGIGTHWLQGNTMASFGSSIGVDSLTITSPTSATVQITVLSTAPVGFVPLTMSTDGEVATLQQAIDVEEGSPALLAISPGAAQQGATLNLQVLGRYTNWQSMLTSLAFNQDITVNSVSVIDSDTLAANITVSPWAYVDAGSPCGHALTVTTGSEQVNTSSINDNFCVQPGAAQINSVSPLSTPQGSTLALTITGSATHFLAGVTTVSFSDSNFQVGQVTVNSPTSLTVSVAVTTSASTGFKTITVQTYGEVATQQYSFTVQPGVATLNEAIPNQAQQGTQNLSVHLVGQYSHFNANSTATFGPGITVNSVTFTDATDLTANITVDPLAYTGTNNVTVDSPGVSCAYQPPAGTSGVIYSGCTPGNPSGTGDEIVNANIFGIATGPAIITQVAPATGNQGQEVVFNITGSNTHWAQNITQFYIAGGGSDIAIHSVIVNSPTSATVDMSISSTAGLGTRSVYMITAGESLVDSGAFVVTGGIPVITYLSPASALQGTTGLQVTINGLYTQWNAANTAQPTFGPGVTVASYQVDDATHISAVVNVDPAAQTGYRTVVVQTGTGQTAQFLTSNFLVTAPAPPPTPSIWYFTPSQGLPGQTFDVQFSGSSTHWDGTTTATFGSGIQMNSFQVTSPTSAIANITITAASAQTVPISFSTTSDSEVEDVNFNVVVAQPTLSIVDPGSGMQGAQSITVDILGQYTTFDNTTAFSFGPGITVNSVNILGPTIATATISIDQLATLGGRSVTATSDGVTVGGAGFSVTPSLAQMVSVTPNTALQGQTITVAVAGQNTHWNGSTVFRFGSGIVVTTSVVSDPTDATLTLAIPPLAPIGATSASATTGGEIASLSHAFVVQPGTPVLLSSGPGSVEQQGAAVFTILGQATTWTQATPPVVSYGAGIDIGSVTVTSPTSLTVQAAVEPLTPTGSRNLTVSTGTQVLGIANAVYVAPGPAVVNSIVPSTAGQNSTLTVTIAGINTHWQQGTTQLTFPGVQINTFTIDSPTTATANITVSQYATPGLVNITMTTLGEVAAKSNAFEITQTQPEMIYINPPTAMLGQTGNVTITALNTVFGGSGTTTSALFGTGVAVNTVTPISATQLQANITVQPTTTLGYRPVSVTTTGTPSGTQAIGSSTLFQVVAGPAAIAGLSPASGGQGNSVTVLVTGSQTNFTSGVTTASFGEGAIKVTGISVVDLTHANVTVSIPSTVAVGAYDVTMTTGGEVATILGGFSVTNGNAKLIGINPPTGNQGASSLNVTLTGQFTNFVNGVSIASFGAGTDITVNSTTVTSPATAVANINISNTAALTSHTVTVTTNSEVASLTGGFTVLAGVPAINSASPGTGQAGSTVNVVIDGAFTSFQQGVTTVSLGSGTTTNFVTVANATQLTANVTISSTATAGARDIVVTTNSQTETLSSGFSVTPGTPVITQINPNIGNPGQTLNVTIAGLYTNWVNGTTNATFGPNITTNSTTVNSATSLTANITVSAAAPLGPADVTTTTNSEVETVAGGFTIQAVTIPAPSLLSLSPGNSATGMPVNASIIAVFSQPMNRTTFTSSTVLLTLTSNPGGYVSVPGTITVDATGRVLTFTPNAPLAVNSQYLFQLASGIKDATGNTFNSYGAYLNTADAAATTAPTVVAANPPANAAVGTNVSVQLQFSADMNQSTQAGLTLTAGGNPVAGAYSWNSSPTSSIGSGTIVTFTPSAPLAAGATYTVTYSSTLTDLAGNALTPGSFTFTTGSGPDTVQNHTSVNFNGQGNVGTNFAPAVAFAKPVNPIDINTGTLLLYNDDSGKYIQATVAPAPNGLSATLTPSVPLLPDTYYHLHQSSGYYDVDGNYLNGIDAYFTTGAGSDTTPPQVTYVSPADSASSIPLNTQIVVKFSAPINSNNIDVIQVTPSGGSPIPGTPSLSSDLVTLTFTPTAALQSNTVYTVQVSGYSDVIGNSGTTFTSTFTTTSTALDINVSTGIDVSGNLITTGDTVDPHWTYVPTTGPSGEAGFQYPGTQPLKVVAPGQPDFYSAWVPNGPSSSWIAINPGSATGNSYGFYSTSFTLPSPLPSGHLCLAGAWGHDDNGILAINGTPIMSDQSTANTALVPLNIDITGFVTPGTNYLIFGFGSTDNNIEGLRLTGTVETCGASVASALSLTSAAPANNAAGVSTATDITLTFNNPVDPLTVNAATLPVMVGWNSNQQIAGNYQVNGNIVTFTPDTPFPVDTNIWVGACNGPLDLAGDSAGGCYTQLTNFTTGATATVAGSAFQVTAFAPASNAVNVGLRAPVVATFNRSFNPNTVNPSGASDFALFSGDSQQPWCAGSSYMKSQDNTTLQFNCYPLPSSTPMTAMLNSNLQDWQGNSLTNFTSVFNTAPYDSNTNGSLITSRPGNGAGGVNPSQPIVLYFNLPINSGTANGGIQVAQNNVAVPGSVQVLDGGYTLQFTPTSPFANGALIQWWTTGSLADSTYNTPVNGASGYFYTAASTGTLVPAVQVTSPPQYSNPVPQNTVFDVQFNTPLNAATVNSSNIYVYDSSTSLNVPVTYSQPQPNEVLMVPQSDLPANHYIYVYVATGLQSATSVPATAANWYVYTGSPDDTSLPVIASAVPYNGAHNVGVNISPGVVLSKPVDPVSLNANTFQVLQGTTPLAGTYWISSSDTRIEFVPNAPLPPSTTLTMNLNGIIDREGHPIAYSSSFQTGSGPDFTAPSVVWTSVPTSGSVPTNSSIAVQFSESMDVTTFSSSSSFYIRDNLLNVTIPATLSWSSDQSAAYLAPSSPLAAGRQYTLNVNTGTDLAGNQVNGYSQSFYAEFGSASTAPAVILFNPLGGAKNIGANAVIQAEFSGAVDPTTLSGVTLGTGGVTVPTSPVMSAGNTVVELVPQTPLAAGTTYTITVAGVKDPAGNGVPTATSSFTTGSTYDINPPSVISYDPPNYATVGTNVIPKLVFNKPLNPITVTNNTFRMYVNQSGQWVPLTATPSADGLSVTLQPQIALLPDTLYHYQACCNYQDQNGNSGNQIDLYFYTGTAAVTTAPTVAISPVNGSTGVPLNSRLIAASSSPIDVTSWSQNSLQLFDSLSNPIPGFVSQIDGQTLSFTPTTASPVGTSLGCYADNGNRVLNGYSYSSNSMTVEGCVTACGSQGYTYAGVQSGTQCFCGNGVYSTLGASTACTSTCGGNSGETCGGSYANNVYTAQPNVEPANLSPSATYTAKVSGFTDTSGNPVTPASSAFTTSGTASTSGLALSSTNIPSGASGVSATQPIVLTFSQILDPTTVNAGTLKVMNTWNSALGIAGSYSVVGDQVTFTPTSPYPAGSTIYVGECGGPTDVLDEVFLAGACYSQQLVYFTVSTSSPDTSALQVTGVQPVDGAANVGLNQPVSVTFNKSVSPGSAANYNSMLFAGQSLQTNGSVTWSADNRTMTFNPGALYNGTSYTIALPAGGIADMSGNSLQTDFISTFSTLVDPSSSGGSVIGNAPANNATGVPTNTLLTLYLNRQVNASTLPGNVNVTVNGQLVAGTVTSAANGYEVQFTPGSAFPNGAVVQWFFSNVQDTGGDTFSSTSNSFTTVASVDPSTAQPTIVAVSPGYGSNNVPTNAGIDIQYSQPIDPTTLTAANLYFNSGTPVNIAAVTPYLVRITPVSPLSASTQYYFCATSGVKGTNGVATPGGCWTTYFTTTAAGDTTPGTITLGPPNGVVNVGTNAYIRVQFSKPADRTTVNSTNVLVMNGANAIPGTWSYNYNGSDLMGANFYPLNPLPPSTSISVTTSGLLDYAGNTFSSASSQFTTAQAPDYTNPNVSFDFPNSTTGIGTNAGFTCRYTEPMDPASIAPGGTYVWSYATSSQVQVTYSYSSDLMSVTMTPQKPLTAGAEYNYTCNNALDLTGNAQNNGGSYTFYTGAGPDTTGPSLLQTNPPNGFTGVPLNSNNGPFGLGTSLGLLFSEPLSVNSLSGITLTPQGGSPLAINLVPEIGDTGIMAQLPSALLPNTTYTFSVSGVTDYEGNAIAPVTTTFTTGANFDWTPPTVASTSPANNATAVPDNISALSVTFSEAMNPVLIDSAHVYLRVHNTQVTVGTTFTISPDDKTVTLAPVTALAPATIYDIVTASPNWYLTDIAGNVYSSTGVVATFTTQ